MKKYSYTVKMLQSNFINRKFLITSSVLRPVPELIIVIWLRSLVSTSRSDFYDLLICCLKCFECLYIWAACIWTKMKDMFKYTLFLFNLNNVCLILFLIFIDCSREGVLTWDQVYFFPFCLGDVGKDHCGFFLVPPMSLAHVFVVLWHQASIWLSCNCLIYWLKHYSPRLNPADGSNTIDECWRRMHIYSRIIRKNNWYNLIIHTIQTYTSTLYIS